MTKTLNPSPPFLLFPNIHNYLAVSSAIPHRPLALDKTLPIAGHAQFAISNSSFNYIRIPNVVKNPPISPDLLTYPLHPMKQKWKRFCIYPPANRITVIRVAGWDVRVPTVWLRPFWINVERNSRLIQTQEWSP